MRYLPILRFIALLSFLLLAACDAVPSPNDLPTAAVAIPSATLPPAATAAPSASPSPQPTETPTAGQEVLRDPTPANTAAPTVSAAPTNTPAPLVWQDLPVIPVLSARARQVYQAGLAKGSNPHVFAKAGDCETITDWFLNDFDRGPRFYSLGPYQDLQQSVIDYFKGSFGRSSLAARRGFNAAALLSVFWSDAAQCKPDETPLACEFRLTRPSLVLIMVGTNDVPHKASFEANLRKVIQFSLEQDVLPVLVTKADNLEGDNSINATIASLAQEYGLPLWNFWRAVQSLPNAGLVADGAHLTYATNFFDDPEKMKSAWPWRNLTALQVLDAILKGVK